MEVTVDSKIYKPLVGGLYWWIVIPTSLLMIAVTVSVSVPYWPSLLFMIPICGLMAYFFISPLFGYVELRENSVFVRFGFFVTREISYGSIRGVSRERKLYAESMMSLKNAMEHVNIKYGRFDVITVSVVDNDGFVEELERRLRR